MKIPCYIHTKIIVKDYSSMQHSKLLLDGFVQYQSYSALQVLIFININFINISSACFP